MRILLGIGLTGLLLASCSLVNAPADVEASKGAGGGDDGATTTTSGTMGQGGGGGEACAAIDTLADCGACGVNCEPENAVAPTCAGGLCDYGSCAVGFEDCDADHTNGCEVDPLTDPTHCGDCAHDCADDPLVNVSTFSCVAGVCGVGTCDDVFGDCDLDPTNGCEM